MPAVLPSAALALAAALLLLLLPLFASHRRRAAQRRERAEVDSDTPLFAIQAVRVLTQAERRAHALLVRAMPGFLVLAQVPLTRFMRVDSRRTQWLSQSRGLCADLLLCDSRSRVLAVVNVRSTRSGKSSIARHDQMARLLKAAGVKVLSWNEDALPDVEMIRAQVAPLLASPAPARPAGARPSRHMPLIPVAEVLAEGDSERDDPALEPVASALFDEFEPDLALPAKA